LSLQPIILASLASLQLAPPAFENELTECLATFFTTSASHKNISPFIMVAFMVRGDFEPCVQPMRLSRQGPICVLLVPGLRFCEDVRGGDVHPIVCRCKSSMLVRKGSKIEHYNGSCYSISI
jgi:hypothetical protein